MSRRLRLRSRAGLAWLAVVAVAACGSNGASGPAAKSAVAKPAAVGPSTLFGEPGGAAASEDTAAVAVSCSEPASAPLAGEWWVGLEESCPDGTSPTRREDRAFACLLPDRAVHGPEIFWGRDGGYGSVRMYCNGVLHGAYADWHERGHVWMQGNYRNGNKHGMWRTSYPTGELKDEVEYRGGKFHGTDKYWSRDGALVHERRWVDGALVEAD